jgi:hypothetical protein
MPKGKSGGKKHAPNVNKEARTALRRQRKAARVEKRKNVKPQPVPQAGRAARREGMPQKKAA